MQKIKIAVVDDQLLFRKGLISLLNEYEDIQVMYECSNGRELLDRLKSDPVDVVILDLEMPVLSGIETTRLLKTEFPKVKVIVLTMHNDEEFVVELLKKGAHGFLLKDQDIEVVVGAVYAVTEVGYYFNPAISEVLVRGLINNQQIAPTFKKASFTAREIQVVEWICRQLSNKEIAEKMNISVRTVDGYLEKIFQKTGVRNRAGIVMFAVQHNIVSKSIGFGEE